MTIPAMMQEPQIRAIESSLLSMNRRSLSILEWGSGGSTLHYTQFLRSKNIQYQWYSVEHNREWFEKISDLTKDDTGIHVKLFDYPYNRDELLSKPMTDYIRYPRQLNIKFDLILVDGRKRADCLIEAKNWIAPHGLVYLHDAQRRRYRRGFQLYADNRFVDHGLWVGRTQPVSLMRQLDNFFNRFGHYYLYKHVQRFKGIA